MRACPQCTKTFRRFTYTAWVLQVTGTIEEDSDGLVNQIGPAHSTVTIKKGKELDAKSCQITCPFCKYQDYKQEFKIVRPCILTGMVGDTEIKTPVGTLIINASALEAAQHIFTEQNLAWSSNYSKEMELF